MKIEQGNYGPVMVVRGRHVGRVGYYDDDAGSKGQLALVYFDTPFESEGFLINRDFLVEVTKHRPTMQLQSKHPGLAKQLRLNGDRHKRLWNELSKKEQFETKCWTENGVVIKCHCGRCKV